MVEQRPRAAGGLAAAGLIGALALGANLCRRAGRVIGRGDDVARAIGRSDDVVRAASHGDDVVRAGGRLADVAHATDAIPLARRAPNTMELAELARSEERLRASGWDEAMDLADTTTRVVDMALRVEGVLSDLSPATDHASPLTEGGRDALRNLLHSETPTLRLAALSLFGQHGLRRADIPTVGNLFWDRDPDVRRAAATLIGDYGDVARGDDTVLQVHSLLDKDRRVQRACRDALEVLHARTGPARGDDDPRRPPRPRDR